MKKALPLPPAGDPTPRLPRRRFLQSTLAAGLPLAFPLGAWAAAERKLRHACIGVGGMGDVDLQNFLQHPRVDVVALCDVDSQHLQAAAAKAPNARKYQDWRELLDQERDRVDSVNVTVPDHMHYVIAASAIRRGKHVYCQKPMCHDVVEVRLLTEAAARAGVVTQLGTQAASSVGERTAVQLLRHGAIGTVSHAYLCSNRPGAVEAYRLKGPRPAQGQEPPPHLSWDLWLGTAPERPYAPDIYHPTKWRAWLDFGTGWSGDIGCHIFDAVWKGLEMQPPKSVVAEVQDSWRNAPDRRADTWPQGDHITWVFPGTRATGGKDWTLEWFDGEFYPPEDIRARYSVKDYPTESAMIIGTEGALLLGHGSGPILLPEDKFKHIPRPNLPARNHYHHFADACLGGTKTESHFAQTGPMTEAILLGTVAVRRPGEQLQWDPKEMQFPGNPTATQLLRRRYREGWSVLPG